MINELMRTIGLILGLLCCVTALVGFKAVNKRAPAPQHYQGPPVTFCRAILGNLPPELGDADCSYPNVRNV